MSTVAEMKDSAFDNIWNIKRPKCLALKEIRLCDCFLDKLCPLFKELFEARGRDSVESIIFPKIFDICTNHPKSKMFLSDDLLIVCCKEALYPPRFMDLVLANESKMVENCEIDLMKKHEMRNCIFFIQIVRLRKTILNDCVYFVKLIF